MLGPIQIHWESSLPVPRKPCGQGTNISPSVLMLPVEFHLGWGVDRSSSIGAFKSLKDPQRCMQQGLLLQRAWIPVSPNSQRRALEPDSSLKPGEAPVEPGEVSVGPGMAPVESRHFQCSLEKLQWTRPPVPQRLQGLCLTLALVYSFVHFMVAWHCHSGL